MIEIQAVFWLLVLLFAVIGAFRGASKELLVTTALILFLFINSLLAENIFASIIKSGEASAFRILFWVRTGLVAGLTLAGYQIPDTASKFKTRVAGSERVDKITGFIIGGINAYLLWGTLWFFLIEVSSNVPDFIGTSTFTSDKASKLIEILPPAWLQGGWLTAVVVFMFVFIIVIII